MPTIVRIPYPKDILAKATSFLWHKPDHVPHILLTDDELRDRDPHVFEQLEVLRDRFRRAGRSNMMQCAKFKQQIHIEACMAYCPGDCRYFDVAQLLGDKDTIQELIDDVIKLQRVINILHHRLTCGEKETKDDDATKSDS